MAFNSVKCTVLDYGRTNQDSKRQELGSKRYPRVHVDSSMKVDKVVNVVFGMLSFGRQGIEYRG